MKLSELIAGVFKNSTALPPCTKPCCQCEAKPDTTHSNGGLVCHYGLQSCSFEAEQSRHFHRHKRSFQQVRPNPVFIICLISLENYFLAAVNVAVAGMWFYFSLIATLSGRETWWRASCSGLSVHWAKSEGTFTTFCHIAKMNLCVTTEDIWRDFKIFNTSWQPNNPQ